MLEARQHDPPALRLSEERLRCALEASQMSYWDFDVPSGKLYLSPAWSRLLGGPFEATETTYETLAERVPHDERSALQAALHSALKDPLAEYRVEHRVIRDDGSWFWNRCEGCVIERDAAGRALRMVGTNRDITELKLGLQLLEGQKRVLEMIAEEGPLAPILEALVGVIEQQTAPRMLCSVLLLDADGEHLRHGAAPSLPPAYTRAIDGAAIGPAAGSCGTAAYRRKTIIVEDIASDPLWADYAALALRHGLRACWSRPIFGSGGRVLGTFAMYFRQPRRPDRRDLSLIGVAAQTAALAIGQRSTQQALRQSTAALEQTFESMDQGISISDAELRLVGTNQRFCELLDMPAWLCRPGTPAAAMFRHKAERGDYGPGDVESQVSQRLELARRAQAHHFVRERPDGTVLEIRGRPVAGGGFVTIYSDVTQRARSERGLLRFRAALDLSSDGIYLIDLDALIVVDCNDGACRTLGYRREQLIGMAGERILADTTHQQLRAAYDRLVAGDGGEATLEALHRRSDGSAFPVEINRRVHRTPDATIVVAVARDISARKRAEASLRDSEERLRALVRSLGAAEPDPVLDASDAARGTTSR